MTDDQFFATFPTRQARIRQPERYLDKDRQRAVRYLDECEIEFRHLGSHDKSRRVPQDNPWYDPTKPPILKIPFLAFADETIENEDHILLPILHEMMTNARARA